MSKTLLNHFMVGMSAPILENCLVHMYFAMRELRRNILHLMG